VGDGEEELAAAKAARDVDYVDPTEPDARLKGRESPSTPSSSTDTLPATPLMLD
jgi:hypothetical protein